MSWWMGAGLGFLRGGPFGAVVGGVAEHFLGKKIQKKLQKGLPGIAEKSEFITCMVIILSRVGSVKGSLTQNQIKIVHKFFQKNLDFVAADFKAIDPLIVEVQNKKPDIEQFVEGYKKSCKNNYNLLLLALCYQITLVENNLEEGAEKLLQSVALLLGLSYEQHNKIRVKYSLKALKTPYHVLGLSSEASNEEVKKAYRSLISACHPDRVANEGEEAVEAAHLKFLEIQEAYQELEGIRKI
ncbi:MAG: DnaJ domain-containing protein [Nitrospina sp.]|jgi:DnaJ like chaperone protein|nr:DnaJ domain-containing protein [Nitrospina sp.]MBT6717935.1 DnaJ domain-containing protein [Nitrospina sp.]